MSAAAVDTINVRSSTAAAARAARAVIAGSAGAAIAGQILAVAPPPMAERHVGYGPAAVLDRSNCTAHGHGRYRDPLVVIAV